MPDEALMPLYPRSRYEREILAFQGSALIKVLTGLRRSGKSSLMRLYAEHVRGQGVPETNLLSLQLDGFDVPLVPSAEWLDELLRQSLAEADARYPLYVFLDEVQEVDGWEKVVRRLHESGRADIYLTGSNANLLSTDLATYLAGRYVEIPVYPLSFSEFTSFVREAGSRAPKGLHGLSVDALFAVYLRFGGMPVLFSLSEFSQATVQRELTAIHDTVVLNDVARRFRVRDISLLARLVRYLYSTSGNLFSPHRIANYLTSAGCKTSTDTVDAYLRALTRAFAIYPCEECGLSGKRVLQPLSKYYAPDTGMRNRECGFNGQDVGFQLESVVYMELKRRNYEVSVGKLKQGEVDFVASAAGGGRMYVQVTNDLLDDRTRSRELSALEGLPDSFPKLVLTRDEAAAGVTSSGITIRSLTDWLLDA